MGNLADWLIPLAIAVVVVCVTFVVASGLLQRAKNGGDVGVPPPEEILNEEANVGPLRAGDKPQGAKLPAWKQVPRGIRTYLAAGVATILLVFAGGAWLFKPHKLDCASKEARELVSQIAAENDAMMTEAASRFIKRYPLPKSPALIAAERAYAQRVAGAEQEWRNYNSAGSRDTTRWLDAVRDSAAAHDAIDAVNAAAFASVVTDVRKEVKYTLDTIRTTDKNLSGALTCAATLKGDGGKYGDWTKPITYKVEETSDGRLYVGVSGLR
jgi:hypothetical protein